MALRSRAEAAAYAARALVTSSTADLTSSTRVEGGSAAGTCVPAAADPAGVTGPAASRRARACHAPHFCWMCRPAPVGPGQMFSSAHATLPPGVDSQPDRCDSVATMAMPRPS
jgi:hypothetical protein